jgi:hypothetical protein
MTCETVAILPSARATRSRNDWFDMRWLLTCVRHQHKACSSYCAIRDMRFTVPLPRGFIPSP